jgi:hypothetical protein
MPTERIEHQTPTGVTEVDNLDDAQLEELVRRGREARLHLLKE